MTSIQASSTTQSTGRISRIGRTNSIRWHRDGITVITILCTLLVVAWTLTPLITRNQLPVLMKETSMAVGKNLTTGSAAGVDGAEEIPFIRCVPAGHDDDKAVRRVEIMLLHGAKFNKETWLKHSGNKAGETKHPNGMIGELCSAAAGGPSVAVTAVDLTTRTRPTARRLLSAIRSVYGPDRDVRTLLVVVTPSASGGFAVDWIIGGGGKDFPSFGSVVDGWVPVAAPAVLSAEKKIGAATETGIWPRVLAVYGEKDEMGKRSTEKLAKEYGMPVDTLEIKNGSHPAYLDDSGGFVTAVSKFMMNTVVV